MSQRWAWTYRYRVGLFVTSLVAVVLAAAGLVAVVVLSRDNDGGGPSGGITAADEAGCVVGRWQVVEQSQELSVGTFRLVDSTGPTVSFDAEDNGQLDYGDGVNYYLHTSVVGQLGSGDFVIDGTIGFRYTITREGVMRYDNFEVDSNLRGTAGVELPHQLSDEPFDFTCEQDVMTQHIEGRYEARLERLP